MNKTASFLCFEIKRAMRHWVKCALLMLVLALAAAGTGLAFSRYGSDEARVAPFSVAVNIPDGAGMHYSLALGMVSSMDSFQSMVDVKRTNNEEKARGLLEEGAVRAVVLIPDGMIHGIMYGENIPATVLYPGTPGVESVLFRNMVDALSRMLSDSQSGVYAVDDVFVFAGMSESAGKKANNDVNEHYINMVLSRGDFFTTERTDGTVIEEGTQEEGPAVSDTGNSPERTVAAGIIALFMLLSGCCLVSYFFAESRMTGEYLTSFGLNPAVRQFCTWLGGFLILLLNTVLLMALALLIPAGYALLAGQLPVLLAAAAAGSALCAALALFITRACRSYSMSIIILFTAAFLLTFMAGGLMSGAFLPAVFRRLYAVNPAYWLIDLTRNAMSGRLAAGPLIRLAGLSLILILLSSVFSSGERKGFGWIAQGAGLRRKETSPAAAGTRFAGWLKFCLRRELVRPLSLLSAAFLVICALFLHTDAQAVKRIRVSLYCASPDEVTRQVMDELCAMGGSRLYQFVEEDSEQALRNAVDECVSECGFILPDDLISVLSGETEEKMRIVISPDTTLELMIREDLFESVFRRYAPVWLERYILDSNTGLAEEKASALTRERYDYWLGSGETFYVEYENVADDFFRDETAFRLPVRGLIAILLYICAAAGMSSLKRDIRRKRVIIRRRGQWWQLGIIYEGLALLLPAVFALVCLFAGTEAVFSAAGLAREALRLIAYLAIVAAANLCLGRITGDGVLFDLLTAPIVIFFLIYSPAVFDLQAYLPAYDVIKYFTVIFWYLM